LNKREGGWTKRLKRTSRSNPPRSEKHSTYNDKGLEEESKIIGEGDKRDGKLRGYRRTNKLIKSSSQDSPYQSRFESKHAH